jgi:hypothetical protein
MRVRPGLVVRLRLPESALPCYLRPGVAVLRRVRQRNVCMRSRCELRVRLRLGSVPRAVLRRQPKLQRRVCKRQLHVRTAQHMSFHLHRSQLFGIVRQRLAVRARVSAGPSRHAGLRVHVVCSRRADGLPRRFYDHLQCRLPLAACSSDRAAPRSTIFASVGVERLQAGSWLPSAHVGATMHGSWLRRRHSRARPPRCNVIHRAEHDRIGVDSFVS